MGAGLEGKDGAYGVERQLAVRLAQRAAVQQLPEQRGGLGELGGVADVRGDAAQGHGDLVLRALRRCGWWCRGAAGRRMGLLLLLLLLRRLLLLFLAPRALAQLRLLLHVRRRALFFFVVITPWPPPPMLLWLWWRLLLLRFLKSSELVLLLLLPGCPSPCGSLLPFIVLRVRHGSDAPALRLGKPRHV